MINKRHRLISALVLFSLTGLASCSKHEDASSKQNGPFTPQEVYVGLFFGTGKAATLFPEIWPAKKERSGLTNVEAAKSLRDGGKSLATEGVLSEDNQRKLTAAAALVEAGQGTSQSGYSAQTLGDYAIEKITAADASFFTRFRAEISSGEQPRVQAVITEGSRRFVEIVMTNIPDPLGSGFPRLDNGFVINVNAAVNVDTALNVNVAYNVDTVKNITNVFSLPRNEESRLKNEMIINAITPRLAGVQFR
jgi:hypothetical protein